MTEDLGVAFLSDKVGFAVGSNGLILRSNSAGAYWVRLESGTRQWLEYIKFSDEKNGVIVGGRGTIFKTFDGGEHGVP